MKRGKFIYHSLCSFFVLLIVCVILPPGSCYAGRELKGEWVLPENYPGNGFDGWGCIDTITNDELVIGDTSLKFAKRVEYYLPEADYKPERYFKKGILAGFLKNNQDEIVSLWYIKKCIR